MNAANAMLLRQMMLDPCAGRMMVRISWLVAVCALVFWGVATYAEAPGARDLMLLFLACGLGYMWCGAFLRSAAQQNLPLNACLVPGLRSRLMRLTAMLFSACTLVTAVLFGLMTGHAGYALVIGGLLSLYALFAQRYAWLNFLPTVVILASLAITRPMEKLLAAVIFIGEPSVTVVGVVVLGLLGWQALRAAFPQGGDRHWAWYRCQKRQLAKTRGELPFSGPGSSLRSLRAPYDAALRTDSRRGAAPGRQMLHALGAPAHDGIAIGYLILSTIVMVLVVRHLVAASPDALLLVTAASMQGLLMLSALMYATALVKHAVRHSGEQSLYRLTPAAPAPAQFNRVLMRTLLFRCLRLWLLSSVAVACIDIAMLGTLEVRGVSYVLSMGMLPFSGLALRNFAVLPTRLSESRLMAVLTMVAIADIMLIVFSRSRPGLPLFWLGTAVAVAGLAGLWLRWQHVVALPPVLPAGRLAD